MANYAVELLGVSKRFPGPGGEIVTAVNHVTLQIGDGEFFSLLGPSGCGKTTSLRMIAGFELPTEGEVMIHGRALGQTPPFKRPVNTVFQNYALFPHMTIGENVAFGLQMKGVPKNDIGPRVSQALAMVRLPGYEQRRPKQMSGGQQQRVALARALVNRPEVLLLDEPLGALDLKLRKAMQLELKTLQREVGITFIYVTHDQEEALTMSDRIAVMSNGVVLQVGDAGDIYERPNCKFVADFIGETNFLAGQVAGLENGAVVVTLEHGPALHAAAEQPPAGGTAVTLAVRPEKMHLGPAREDLGGWDGQANVLPGRVQSVVYIGTDTHYGVFLANGQEVRVRQQNSGPGMRPQAALGDLVSVSFQAGAARVLTE
jgi:spermidine/putrescine transport system ATP-binding protein